MKHATLIYALVAAGVINILSGCAVLGLNQTTEERVASLAKARLEVLMVGDFEGSFEYVAPALRESTTWKDHAYRYAGIRNWVDTEVRGVECVETKCDVTVMVTYKLARYKISNTRPLKEVWIAVDGGWYLYYD